MQRRCKSLRLFLQHSDLIQQQGASLGLIGACLL